MQLYRGKQELPSQYVYQGPIFVQKENEHNNNVLRDKYHNLWSSLFVLKMIVRGISLSIIDF